MKPIIGLTTYGRNEPIIRSIHYDAYYAAPALYIDAVRRAGGVPVLLPPGEPDWRAALAMIDAAIIIGGADVGPTCYQGDPQHPSLTTIDPERDQSELILMQYLARQSRLPTLCICRGMQVLNVALGGSLHPHIPDIRTTDIHRNSEGGWTVQPVSVIPGSRLAEIMQATSVRTYSGHHQAIDRVAPGLTIVATAPDGIIEAFEMPDHPWLVAVQWHPEMSAEQDPTQQHIFDALIAAALTG